VSHQGGAGQLKSTGKERRNRVDEEIVYAPSSCGTKCQLPPGGRRSQNLHPRSYGEGWYLIGILPQESYWDLVSSNGGPWRSCTCGAMQQFLEQSCLEYSDHSSNDGGEGRCLNRNPLQKNIWDTVSRSGGSQSSRRTWPHMTCLRIKKLPGVCNGGSKRQPWQQQAMFPISHHKDS
jgi:hypothetical protein